MASNIKKLTDAEKLNVLAKFVTKQEQYAVPGASVSIPADTDSVGLNKIVKTFLKTSGTDVDDLPLFDFIVKGQIVVGQLQKQLREDEISLEKVLEIEYVKQQPPPTPKDSLQHDDWVSTLQCTDKWLLTGCYDNTVHLWDADGLHAGKGEQAHTLTIPAHKAPVKAVAWVHTDSPTKTFVSASIDQTAVVWVWQSETNTVECVSECRGHTQSVECIAVAPSVKRFATGSWDNMLKIWSLSKSAPRNTEEEIDDSEQEKKKRKGTAKKPEKKTPIMTLSGHTESVGSVDWMSNEEVITGSWDHSLRIWDLEIGGLRTQFNGNCAIFSITYSQKNHTILTGCADKYIRMYDPRVSDGNIVQQKYASHTKWIPSVKWSSVSEYLFVSGGYDNLIKMWDSRRPKAPLFDLTGHSDKVLAVDWSNPKFIASGSADCTAKVYSSTKNV